MSYADHWTNLTPQEQDIVRLYKSSDPGHGLTAFCYEINVILRKQTPVSAQLHAAVQTLDGAIRFPTPDPITLYRGVADVSGITKNPVGGVWTEFSYISTCQTWNRLHTHLKGSGTQAGILTIRVPANTPLLYVDSNPDFGSSEREFLLPRGTRFKLLSHGLGDIGHYLGKYPHKFSGLTEVSLEVLGSNPPPLTIAALT